MKPISKAFALSLAFFLVAAHHASAVMVTWVGTNGVSATTNWSDTKNFVLASDLVTKTTPVNNAGNYTFLTAVTTPGKVTVNVDGAPGTPGSGTAQGYGAFFGMTNGYQTVFIQPGMTWQIEAGAGTPGLGLCVAPQPVNNNTINTVNTPAIGTYTNYTTITGSGGTLYMNALGLRVEAPSTVVGSHYSILDMSGLGTFIMTNTTPGSGNGATVFFYLVNGSANSQGLIYLAQTNIITLYSAFQVGYLGTSSNSLPIGVYLGQSNYIATGANNNNFIVGYTGCTNGFMKFNPSVLGGPTMPTAYLTGNGGSQNVMICNANNGKAPGNAICDFTGGNVTWFANTMSIGVSGAAGISANGILSFDTGTVNANVALVGVQPNSAGAAGVGTINIGANASYQVNNYMILGTNTGTLAAGTAGTINVNGGALAANYITNGGGAGTINVSNGTFTVTNSAGTPAAPISSVSLTNSTLQFGVSLTSTNLVVNNLKTHGSPTVINIISVPSFNAGQLPLEVPLIAYSGTIGDAGYNFTLGTLPPLCAATLTNNSANHTVDLILTAAPLALIWTGNVSGDWDTTTTNWFSGGPTLYADNNFVFFPDGANNNTINLTATLTPNTVVVSNTAPANYIFQGGGNLAGSEALTKLGTGTLVLDETGNTFSGGITISGGSLQVGTNDTAGDLPAGGKIVDNGNLTVDRLDAVTIPNNISGSGTVTEAGAGGTLTLTGINTFTNNVLATNGSTFQLGGATGAGASGGSLIIANGSTLDVKGFGSSKSVVVSGTGIGGNGAIVDSGGSVLDTSGGIASTITLAGDTTITFPGSGTRADLVPRPAGGHLNSGGQPYNLTLQTADGSGNYIEFWDVTSDAALGNVTLLSGKLGLCGTTQLGSASYSLILTNSSAIQFYNDGVNNLQLQKPIIMNDGTTIQNSGGASTLGPITFPGSGYCTFNVGGTSLSLTNTLTGAGIVYVTGGPGNAPLYITGNSPAFTGGVLLYVGPLYLNGTIGSGVTTIGGTTFGGTGTANGAVGVSGGLVPGGIGVAGTLTVGGGGANGLTLQNGASLTNDCATTTTVGGGVNDYLVVNGDLDVNNNTIYINPLGASLATSGEYTLISYSGNLNGTFAGVQLVSPSRYTLALDTSTPGVVKLQVTGAGGGGPASLVWNNANDNGEWDVQSSQNWSNSTANVSPDYFFTQDRVTFDDSIASSPFPTTAIDIASGQGIISGGITNNSTMNYTISGAGKITGSSTLTKLGTSKLTINTTNDFTGNVSIQAGSVVAGSTGAIGGTSASLTITNGGTLDMNGFSIGDRLYTVSGAGVGSNGAIVNNGATVFSSAARPNTNVVLTGNTTFGGPNRWDLGIRAGTGLGGVLSTGGNNYKVTMIGTATTNLNSTYWEWESLNVDTNLGDIEIVSGELGVLTSSLGNPTNTVIIDAGGKMTFWGGSGYAKNFDVKSNGAMFLRQTGPTFNMSITLEGGSSIGSADLIKTNYGPITLPGGIVSVSNINATCALAGVISGAGGINLTSGDNNSLVLLATNTYTGPTLITASGTTLALAGNGSISASTNITVIAGATFSVSGRSDSTLTLASGQTLNGGGTITGSLTAGAGSAVSPGILSIGTLNVSGTVSLQGNTLMDLGAGSNDVIAAPTIGYGGTLVLSFTPGALVNGNSFKLFNATTYSGGSFVISPASPGSGLAWDTSALNTTGTLKVTTSVPPDIGSLTVSGTSLTITGTAAANSTFRVLTSTNLVSRTNTTYWTQIYSGMVGSDGTFTTSGLTNNPAEPQRYYTIVQP